MKVVDIFIRTRVLIPSNQSSQRWRSWTNQHFFDRKPISSK